MAKPRTVYICKECGYETAKWIGKCSDCGAWNSLKEEVRGGNSSNKSKKSKKTSKSSQQKRGGYGAESGDGPVKMSSVKMQTRDRLHSGSSELDRVLGGGFVAGGVMLLGGDPGIGKSTLSLQVAGMLAERDLTVLYVTGEESLGQLKMRGDRLFTDTDDVLVVGETRLERAEQLIDEEEPDFLILDSIQTLATEELTSSPGSVVQLREVTGTVTQLAKGTGMPTILVGHVTKQGAIAGPKVLEHMVDTVLYFEGQTGMNYRILRAVKNRYGSTNEIGVFEMRGDGLHGVENPSAMFLAERPKEAPGSVVVPVVEGTRPLLVEVQALVSSTNYGPPNVTTVGVEQNRVNLLLNILEKRAGMEITDHDVFVNVAGGVEVSEPAADLGIAAAIVSSYRNRPVAEDAVLFGEMGLTGEVRAVSRAPARLVEAQKLGFERAIAPRSNASGVEAYLEGNEKALSELRFEGVGDLGQALRSTKLIDSADAT